jgi:putative addiction module component (TIGR02574 family)
MATVNDLFDQAMKLSPAEREELADRLWQTILPEMPGEEISQEEWETVWGEEIARRVEQLERGEVQTRDAWEALDELRKKLRERRGI